MAIGLIAGPAAAQVGLRDLPVVADGRAKAMRPAMEKALQPFWGDLSLPPGKNRGHLREVIGKIVKLGGGVAPLLIEKLTPSGESEAQRNLAHNCAEVLMRMDPASLTPSLLELLTSPSETARIQATRLLAKTQSPEAGARLAMELPKAAGVWARTITRALQQLGYRAAAPKVVDKMLRSEDTRDREAALGYLAANPAVEVMDAVLVRMRREPVNTLLVGYVAYLRAVGERRVDVAELLVEMLNRGRLGAADELILIRTIGAVAPEKHKATVEDLLRRIEEGTGQRARAMAMALRALGDNRGVELLNQNLSRALADANNRRDPRLYEQRGDLAFELENWTQSVKDYTTALKFEKYPTRAFELRLKIARSEAGRSRWIYMVRALKDANATKEQILALAEKDANVKSGLLESSVQRYLNSL